MAALLDRYRDYTDHRRIMLSGDLPGAGGGHTIRDRMTGDTGELGLLWGAGYYYNATYNSMIASDTANTQFIHGAFNYSATSGTGRGAYYITKFSGAGAVSGECIRARAVVSAATTGGAIHGIHAEARLLSGGSQSGTTCGIRATLAAESGSGLTTGTNHALRLDSDFGLTSTAANASFIGVYDVQSNLMPYFLGLSMAAASTGCVKSGTCSTFTKGGLVVRMSDGSTGYIPIGTTCT